MLGTIGFTLTACGSRFNHQASNSAACDWQNQPQHCANFGAQLGRYAQGQYTQGQALYDQNYYQAYYNQARAQQGQFYQQNYQGLSPAPAAVSYVQSPHSIVTYEERLLPLPAPAPVEIAPVEIFEPEIFETAPPISAWPTMEPFEVYPWLPEKICPEGTIRGYNGESCVQVEILRK